MAEKRRLPSWILGASTANKVGKTIDLDENDVITNEETSGVTESTKPKAKRATRKKTDGEKSYLFKCATKRKKRGFVEEDVIENGDCEQEVVVEKRKRAKSLRKKKEKDYEFDSSNEIENHDPSCDEEDVDLTMEDVLSIAKEFVENDKNDTSQHQLSERQSELKTKSSHTSSSVTKTSQFVPQDTKSSIQEETISHHDDIENTTSEVTLSDSLMTGDPAQDMLDLFLGPLLRKPIVKEAGNPIKDIIIPKEIKNQQHDSVITNKPVTITKKKSSLRDTVAMLLD